MRSRQIASSELIILLVAATLATVAAAQEPDLNDRLEAVQARAVRVEARGKKLVADIKSVIETLPQVKACGRRPPRSALFQLERLASAFRDEKKLAFSTSRLALPGGISRMQSIRRDISEVTATPCMTCLKSLTLLASEFDLEVVLEFMQWPELSFDSPTMTEFLRTLKSVDINADAVAWQFVAEEKLRITTRP